MWARGPLLSVLVFVSARLLLTESAPRSGSGGKSCDVGGKSFGEGERLKTADPCLECQCSGGRVDCRLRVCPKLPRPPPPGCFLLQRPASCCASLHCPKGCILNGTVYGEGSAMVTSSLCEYCYCIRGTQHCVRPKCLLSVPACKPEYATHSCCPTKYICSEMDEKAGNSTLISTTSMPSAPPGFCTVEGATLPEGERLTGLEKPCEICYCVKGKPLCDPVICDAPPPPHCSPVLSPGHCCPVSYNCSAVEVISTTSAPELESKEIPNADLTTIVDQTTPASTTMTATSDSETTTTSSSEAPDTTVRPTNETDERFAGSDIDAMETTTSAQEDTTTALQVEVRNGSGKVKVAPDVIEAIINRTLEKDQDYEYDYNEPSLPPSLPNLKIIPFVAADAVLHENEEDPLYAESNLKTPLYPDHLKTTETIYDTPITSMFSPPVETEGGFLPKDPSIDDPFFLGGIKPDHILPPITESSKIVPSEGDATKTSNLSRVRDGVTPTNYIPESLSNLPAITVADGVVTPNPFRDVIRTEPPPHLADIMRDKPIHTTTTTEITTTRSPSSPVFSATSANVSAQTTTTTKTPLKHQENSTDYDYGDNLSISSFLDFFLSGGSSDKSPTTTNKQTTTQLPQQQSSSTTTPHVVAPVSSTPTSFDSHEQSFNAESNTIIHKEAQDRNDFNVSEAGEVDGDAVNNVFTPEKDQLSNPSTNKSPPDASMSVDVDCGTGPGHQLVTIFPRGDVRKFAASERTSLPPNHSLRTFFSEPPKNTQEDLQLLKQRTPGRRRAALQVKCESCHDDPTRGLLCEEEGEQTARAAPQDESQSSARTRHQDGRPGGQPSLRSRLPIQETPFGFISTSPTWTSISKATVKSMTDGDRKEFQSLNSIRGSNMTFTKKELELELHKCRGYCCGCMHQFVDGERTHEEDISDGASPLLCRAEDEGDQYSFRVKVDESTVFSAVLVGFIGLLVSATYFAANTCVPSCFL